LIARVVLALGFVWLSEPHHPDLGLPVSSAPPCIGSAACQLPAAGLSEREAIFKRLREIREELRTDAARGRA
jgi:hypothetical protein